MNITIQSTMQSKQIRRICKIGMEKCIYSSYGMMQDWYGRPSIIQAMSIAYHGNRPIGIALILKRMCGISGVNIAIYVKPTYRRKGAGFRLIERVTSRLPRKKIIAWKDSIKADRLYSKAKF